MALTVVHHPGYTIDLPANHPFPMEKFRVLRQLLGEQTLACPIEWHTPQPATLESLQRVHTRDYVHAFVHDQLDRAAQRRSGFVWSEALVERVRLETGGTLLTLEAALATGLACNSAGGTHHAHADAASGYCLINDLAVAAAHALAQGWAERVLIVDCDVHQGDGTARLFEKVPGVFTLSMHAARNFPARKAKSDLDIALPNGMGDAAYLAELTSWLPGVLAAYQPDVVLYDAGGRCASRRPPGLFIAKQRRAVCPRSLRVEPLSRGGHSRRGGDWRWLRPRYHRSRRTPRPATPSRCGCAGGSSTL